MKRIYRSRRNEDDTENVDMTPLIDMVFILLIFFIVTSVFTKDKGMDVKRPSQQSRGQIEKHNILITITNSGSLRLDGEEIGINSLRNLISRRLRSSKLPVVILADVTAPVGLLTEVMDEARLAGANDISLATEAKNK